ncbi:MAG: GNAT family N-acetyltransferase [Candidatus Omnitrophica bacterium]|nr:GNAT family N-acetyltransferase [Candidatus Omnitrophota bacterium]
MIKFIDGQKVYLRPVLKEDLHKDYIRWINDNSNDVLTGHAMFPHTLAGLEDFLLSKAGDKNCVWLAIVEKKTHIHIGNIELCRIDFIHRNAEYKILIDKKAQRKGCGFEASMLLIEHGFKILNLHRIYLGVHEDNNPAIALYKKLGFKPEGILRQHFIRDGKYSNIMTMGLLSRDHAIRLK